MPRRKKGSSAAGLQVGKSGSGKGSINKGKPQQRNAANARERARMRVLSKAFCRLKTRLPMVPIDTKLSKLDTLRLASQYIQFLSTAVNNEQNSENPMSAEMLVTWPFGFNRSAAFVGGNGSSSAGDGGSEAEENSSGCWEAEPDSPSKDCVHLDTANQFTKHMQIQDQDYKYHSFTSPPNPPATNTNATYDFHAGHYNHNRRQQHQHNSDVRFFQGDVIMSMT